jgi:hypothetical protein
MDHRKENTEETDEDRDGPKAVKTKSSKARGLDAKARISAPSGGEGKMFLDIPLYRTTSGARQSSGSKEGKQAVKMTQLSCHLFCSNQVRLGLSVLA